MHTGFFTDPKYPKNAFPKRIAVVVAAHLDKNPRKDYGHFVEDKYETLVHNLKCHEKYLPGVAYDLILVDSGSTHKVAIQWVRNAIEGKGGVFVQRDNYGYGHGAWVDTYRLFINEYDFFLFTEDDIVPTKNGWLADILIHFLSDPAIGAYGNVVEGRSSTEPGSETFWKYAQPYDRDMMYNLDGGWMFTSARVLDEVQASGGFTIYDVGEHTGIWPNVNEVLLQLPILELGYRIESYDDGRHFLVHGGDIFKQDEKVYDLEMTPLININGRRKIRQVREHFKWLK